MIIYTNPFYALSEDILFYSLFVSDMAVKCQFHGNSYLERLVIFENVSNRTLQIRWVGPKTVPVGKTSLSLE